MSRKFIRTALVLAATLTIPAVMFVAPLPASAANNHVCETNGSYCVGAPNLTLYAAVVETTTGRDINIDSASTGARDFYLKFSADTRLCVAAADNSSDVVIHSCNGGSGIIWRLQDASSTEHCLPTCFFKNRKVGLYLAGDNKGDQFQLKPHPLGGWYEKFTVS